ncbi:VOC family protein [Streptomyces sp. V2I9]|uniref:VOC family protein n=1 Tax=unclassified Streptomyces TaxID=2593676 RepID=UPI00277D4D49|nr:VOC family protein [Streptomyces sp. V2I9]MDQ0985086.1 putative glyoxalase superfamily protein PhnB [Streptomyces sp. V2I9]
MTASTDDTTAPRDGITGLGVILGSTDSDALIAWYRAALEPLGARWAEHLLLVGPGAIIGFDQRDDVADRAAEPGRQLINLTVRDIRAAEKHLNSLGVTWVRPVEEVGGGWFFSTLVDPVGNYLQILQGPETA